MDGAVTATVEAKVTAMELQDFLDHVDSGALIEGGSEYHRFMHDAAQEAFRITAELNSGYPHPTRYAP